MKIQWKRLLVLASAMVFLGVNIKGLADEAAAESRKFSVLSISGEEAYVNKGGVREVKAAAGMPLGQGSTVRTGTQTSLYFEADDDKTIKLDSNTQVEITKSSSKKLKLTLKSGEMFFNVDRPLSEGEELTFDAAQTSMSIRGTSGVLGFHEKGIDLYLIEGKVDWNIGNEAIHLEAGQRASLIKEDNEALNANQMSSAYLLQAVEPFTWADLSAMGLEAALEQRENVDLSAIGLNSQESFDQAAELAAKLRAEQNVKEEREIKRMQEEAAEATSEAVIWDDDDDDDEEERPVQSTTAAPEETLPEETTAEETTSEESSSAAEESSTAEEESSSETPPTSTISYIVTDISSFVDEYGSIGYKDTTGNRYSQVDDTYTLASPLFKSGNEVYVLISTP